MNRAPAPGPLREFGRFLEIQNLGLNLPFVVAFLFAAAHGIPPLRATGLILVAFLTARNAGHSFNRWADRDLDADNPRTQGRALVTGAYSPTFALALVAANAALFLLSAYLLNTLAFVLAPVALALLLGYSYTKRHSAGTTVVLGLVEAVTPAGVYIGLTGTLAPVALLAVGAVLLWGTAFESIHSLGDLETDRRMGLYSLPASLGPQGTVRLIPALHASALVLFAVYAYAADLGLPVYLALGVIAGIAGAIDLRVARRPSESSLPFQLHFVLGAIFLAGVLGAVLFPGPF